MEQEKRILTPGPLLTDICQDLCSDKPPRISRADFRYLPCYKYIPDLAVTHSPVCTKVQTKEKQVSLFVKKIPSKCSF